MVSPSFLRVLSCALLAVAIVGCSAAAPAAPAVTPLVVYVTPAPIATTAPAASPAPTADPEAIRTAAGTAYLAAAGVANKARKVLDKKYPTFKTVAKARAYFKASAKIEGTFILAMKKIVVPADTAGDMHSLIVKETAAQALDLEAAVARSWLTLGRLNTDLGRAARALTAAANLIRSDLNLPPVKF